MDIFFCYLKVAHMIHNIDNSYRHKCAQRQFDFGYMFWCCASVHRMKTIWIISKLVNEMEQSFLLFLTLSSCWSFGLLLFLLFVSFYWSWHASGFARVQWKYFASLRPTRLAMRMAVFLFPIISVIYQSILRSLSLRSLFAQLSYLCSFRSVFSALACGCVWTGALHSARICTCVIVHFTMLLFIVLIRLFSLAS